MSRLLPVFGLVIVVLAPCAESFGQNIPACYPSPFPAVRSRDMGRSAPPIGRTVQVDVPVPCAPVGCGPVMPYPAHPCCPPVCAPPTRPVQVRVDVRVQPEPYGQQPPDDRVCRDYGGLGPVIGLAAATLALPIQILEGIVPPACRPAAGVCGPPYFCYPAQAPVYMPPTPVRAHQKGVPRPACRPVMQPYSPQCVPGPSIVGGSSR